MIPNLLSKVIPGRAGQRGPRLSSLLRMVSRLAPGPPQRRLSYADAIGWFVDHRPPGPAAAQGAIIRTDLPDGGTEVVQVFLDARQQLACAASGTPYGRRLVVSALDQELAEAFGETRLLIVN